MSPLHPTFSYRQRCSVLMLAVAASCLAAASIANAAPINYGDFDGNTVMYLDVTEDANSPGDSPPMFGAPSVFGDSLNFDPVGFAASTTGADGEDLTDGELDFDVLAKPGKFLTNISFSEAGDTTLSGIGTDATYTSVVAWLFLDIQEVDGVAIDPVNIVTPLTFTPSDGTYGLQTDGSGGPLFRTPWSGSATVDLLKELDDEGVSYVNGATKVSFNLKNTLVAYSEEGTSALIAKKAIDGLVVTANIPEPSSLAVALTGLLALAGLCRKSRSV